MPRFRRTILAASLGLALAASHAPSVFAQTSKAESLLKPRPPAVENPSARLDDCPEPEWPADAVRDLNEGTVTVSFLIGPDGRRLDSRLDKSSGFPLLDRTFRSSIEKCSFNPGKMQGVPVKAWVSISYEWDIDEDTAPTQRQGLQGIMSGAYAGKAREQYRAGLAYFNGAGVPRDLAEGLKWMRMAADQELPAAQEALGMMLLAETPDAAAKAEAINWYRKAAMAKRPEAQFTLARLLQKQGERDEALQWLRAAASSGVPPAQSALAFELLRAKGTPALGEALRLLEAAAAKDDRAGQAALASLYETGRGVRLDLAKAVALYEQAAAGGNVQAQTALARLLDSGKGVAQNRARAKELRLQAEAKRQLDE